MITLRPIKQEDIAEIKNWPKYTGEFEQMDYALREKGWLDEFRDGANTRLYAVELSMRLVGFSLINVTAGKEAEFRIAIHPDWTGKGLGREVTLATLQTGFRQLNLAKIHLIVRKNNPRALMLYNNIGLVTTGESVHAIQGNDIEFIDMNMTREQFDNLKIGESA